ncbi:MAG: aldehyde ferredoxin oxidoreductase family protein [Desulfovibrionaceae bacterium]|nr:aldehyde ferredoxin oxidoreductase family protein [Desulfovibrionaceae bacterium]MBF0512504.1 aldehyde ferredoxin oxidoreductase family protein [Desulfovibrionaceae bacterium]
MPTPYFGWTGKVLRIDLSSREATLISPEIEVYRAVLGGKGLAGHHLRPFANKNWDDPELPLCLFTGPLTGTLSPTSGRMTIMSRSPLTGTIGDASVGGGLGTRMKQAGLDGLVITGKSAAQKGIEIVDGRVQFCDAGALTGMGVHQLASRLAGKGSFAAIGPAAENRVAFANIMVDEHFAAGRGGLGLIFAAKNLKYLTIKGSGRVAVHDPKALGAAREDILRLTMASPVLSGEHGFSCYGTGSLYDLMDSRRMMPTDNFRKTHFDQASSLNAFAFKEKYLPRKTGCKGCHILCKKITRGGVVMPEYETMSHFTALCGNTDLDTVVAANALCNDLGMDTISAASTLACHAEISGERLSKETILALIKAIGRGENPELAQGAAQYAKGRNHGEAAMSVKGLELPAYDPRGAYGMSLAYATSTRGGCHLRAYPISHEILRKPVATDRFTYSGKARIVKIAEDVNAVIDSLTACKFIFLAAGLEEYAKAFSAVTGLPYGAQDLLECGERIYYNERIMNAVNGFCDRDDDLPARFFIEDGSHGEGIEIRALPREEFLAARAAYYRIRGLSPQGLPLAEKAKELGLTWNG